MTVDAIFVSAGLFYLTWVGWIPWALSLTYVGMGGVLLHFFNSRSLLVALEAPPGLLPVIVAFTENPLWGWAFIAWGFAAFALDHRRFFVRLRASSEAGTRRKGLTIQVRASFGLHKGTSNSEAESE